MSSGSSPSTSVSSQSGLDSWHAPAIGVSGSSAGGKLGGVSAGGASVGGGSVVVGDVPPPTSSGSSVPHAAATSARMAVNRSSFRIVMGSSRLVMSV